MEDVNDILCLIKIKHTVRRRKGTIVVSKERLKVLILNFKNRVERKVEKGTEVKQLISSCLFRGSSVC